ncbi:MAG: putative bifunctional diguanylate cyclase/phosphodiesterase [Trichloromonadaceae bacterium]
MNWRQFHQVFRSGQFLSFRMVAGYLVLALLWTFTANSLPRAFTANPDHLYTLQNLIDLSFVAFSSMVLCWFVIRYREVTLVRELELREMVRHVCSATGEEFFQTLVQSLSLAVDSDYAVVCEFTDGTRKKVKTVSAVAHGKLIENYQFNICGTPYATLLQEKALVCQGSKLRSHYPDDHFALQRNLDYFAGIPLSASNGDILGMMAIFGQKTLPRQVEAETMLQLFALRAAAELERRQAAETIDYISCYDGLTGLPNGGKFKELLMQGIAVARHQKEFLAVAILDLDRFKKVNDTLGHALGDQLLKDVSERLVHCLRRQDTVARLGGDEFLLLLTGLKDKADVKSIAQKIMKCLLPTFVLDGLELQISASLGIALYPDAGKDAEALVKNADTALNRAKELGRENFQFYSEEMNALSFRQLGMESQLRKGLERSEFFLQYQPQFNVQTGALAGMEALVRWQHPERGVVSPAEFIPLAEETGLVIPLGKWVLRTACQAARDWLDAGLAMVPVAVNLSARQFQADDMPDLVAAVLEETGLAPCYLELEITESAIMQDLEKTIDQLQRLMQLGVTIAIDDFGTGYSSLNYLKRFPIHVLKIDRSFVKDIGRDSDDSAIVGAIIALAHNLKLEVVAEGVETQEQLSFLKERGCQKAQGFLLGYPLLVEEVPALLGETDEMPPAAQLVRI